MSHYAKIATQFKFENELIQALKMIYGVNSIEHHEVAVNLNGYEKNHGRIANIIIRQQHAKTAYGDVGFLFNEQTKRYELIVDNLDLKRERFNLQNLVKKYVSRVVSNRLPRGKYRVKTSSDNTIKLHLIR